MGMIANVKWNKGMQNQKSVSSENELIDLIESLGTSAKKNKHPISVEVKINEGTVLSLVVGLEISVLHFFDEENKPNYFASKGEDSSDEWVAFFMQDHYSEMPLKYFVPSVKAIEAVKEYYRHGCKPTNIQWVTG